MALIESLWIVSLVSTLLAAGADDRSRRAATPRTAPWLTLITTTIIALVSSAQALAPWLRPLLQRDAPAIAAGEWWRLLTALFVQDGGLVGGVFNVMMLLVLGTLAERRWGTRRWLLIVLLGGTADEAVAMALQPFGAGNSVVNFSLAATISVALLFGRSRAPAAVPAIVSLLAETALVLLKDIHGAAALIGAGIATAFLHYERKCAGVARLSR